MTEPNFDWQWCEHQGQLCLKTAMGLHRTPLPCLGPIARPDFTLGQAELYWRGLFALEALHWPAEAVFAACIDALAQLEFGVTAAHKSFYLQTSHGHYQPEPFELVLLCGRNQALALVLDVTDLQSRVMLLTELETLTGRVYGAGHSFSSLHDRLSQYQPPETPWRQSA